LLEQAAEILLAGDVLCALPAGGVGQGFVFHFEPFQPHDTDVILALFPELALTQLHATTIRIGLIERDVSLKMLLPNVPDCKFAASDLLSLG
jgi:hypothetical protein